MRKPKISAGSSACYPGGLQVGGGITDANASEFLEAGASAVIVTSFVFWDGRIDYDCLNRLEQAVGKEHLVLDLPCRYRARCRRTGLLYCNRPVAEIYHRACDE